jgi:hypothetical protein
MKASPACKISEGEGDEGGLLENVSCETAGARGGGCEGSAAKGRGGASGSGRKGGTQQGWGRAFGMLLCDNVLRSRTPSQDERKRRSMSGENPDSSGHTPSSGGFERFRTSNFVFVHFKSCDTHVCARARKHTHTHTQAKNGGHPSVAFSTACSKRVYFLPSSPAPLAAGQGVEEELVAKSRKPQASKWKRLPERLTHGETWKTCAFVCDRCTG